MNRVYRKLAILRDATGQDRGVPVGVFKTAQQVQAMFPNETLIRILDRRYDMRHKRAVMDAWLNGASVQELDQMYTGV